MSLDSTRVAQIVKEAFDNKYETLDFIGRGAQGWCWKVRRVSDGKIAAAKIVLRKSLRYNNDSKSDSTNNAANKKAREDDQGQAADRKPPPNNEAECLRVTRHFAIVAVLDVAVTAQAEVMVLEFVDSGDLMMLIRDFVKNNPGRLLSEQGVGQIFAQIALVLFHLHSVHRILHRDIKSSNVLLTSSGLAKLTDFGLSRICDGTVSNDVADTPLGTPYAIPPEIWKRRRYSAKADVYSLGVLLYELMCLRRPFAGQSLRDLMEQILTGEFEAPPNVFSSDLCSVVTSMLKVNPLERPSIAEVLDTTVMRNFVAELQRNIENPPEGSNFAKIDAEERKVITLDITSTMDAVKAWLQSHAAGTATGSAMPPLTNDVDAGNGERIQKGSSCRCRLE